MSRLSKGFLLLEVSVAIIVLAVGMTFVLRSFNTAISTLKNLQDCQTALLLINEKMFQIKKDGIANIPAEGKFNNGLEKFSWKIEYAPQDELYLDYVNVSVSWPGRPGRTVSAQTYFQQK